MVAKWKSNSKPSVFIDELDKLRSTNGIEVSFIGLQFHRYLAFLISMVEIDDNLSSQTCKMLIRKGIINAAKKNRFNKNTVLETINSEINKALQSPVKLYSLVTTFNIKTNCNIENQLINNCNIHFHKNLPEKFREARDNAIKKASPAYQIESDDPFSYFVIAHFDTNIHLEAVTKLLDSIDLLRGIWNLITNKSDCYTLVGRKPPINSITLGQLHTLHFRDGSEACQNSWYEPDFFKGHKKADLSNNSNEILKSTKNILFKIKESNYSNFIESGIIRYVRALDSLDYSGVLIKLWSVLEYLTSTLRKNYDVTIKRAIFLCSDHDLNFQFLNVLRDYRNRFVHLGTDDNDIEAHVYILKHYVETLLKFHIFNDYKFSNDIEAAEFMELHKDTKKLNQEIHDLEKQISIRQSAIKFLEN